MEVLGFPAAVLRAAVERVVGGRKGDRLAARRVEPYASAPVVRQPVVLERADRSDAFAISVMVNNRRFRRQPSDDDCMRRREQRWDRVVGSHVGEAMREAGHERNPGAVRDRGFNKAKMVRVGGRHRNGRAQVEALLEVLLEPLGRGQRRNLLALLAE
jgi:hypothetical protein